MKHLKIVVALLAVCALIAPALSEPDASDGKQTEKTAQDIVTGHGKPDDQAKCNRLAPRSMMDGRMDRPCVEKPPADDSDNKPAPKSMMDGRMDRPCVEKPPADDSDNKPAPKSMMDGRMDRPCVEKPPADDSDNKPAPKSMMDGRIDNITAVPNKGTVYVVIVQA